MAVECEEQAGSSLSMLDDVVEYKSAPPSIINMFVLVFLKNKVFV